MQAVVLPELVQAQPGQELAMARGRQAPVMVHEVHPAVRRAHRGYRSRTRSRSCRYPDSRPLEPHRQELRVQAQVAGLREQGQQVR